MTWKGLVLFFKKSWVWLKHHWHIPAVLAYTFVMWIIFRKNTESTLEVLSITKDSYKKQVDVLNKTHEEEIVKRDKILREYNDTILRLETEYQDSIRNLDSNKKKRVKDLVENYHDKPDELSRMLSEAFAINYVR